VTAALVLGQVLSPQSSQYCCALLSVPAMNLSLLLFLFAAVVVNGQVVRPRRPNAAVRRAMANGVREVIAENEAHESDVSISVSSLFGQASRY
jgi:hypothetical protein